jgi:hypothetical protein
MNKVKERDENRKRRRRLLRSWERTIRKDEAEEINGEKRGEQK